MFKIVDKLDDDYPHHAFGLNKAGQLFVNGENTSVRLKDKFEELNSSYDDLKSFLLKNKIIKRSND